MIEWTWSNGEKCERSLRHKINEVIKEDKYREIKENEETQLNQKEETQLNQREETQLNQREETYNRIAERELISRVPLNPFFTK
jgi:hypothetical protein